MSSNPMSILLIRSQQALGLSQRELGDIMGCSRRSVIRYMSGRGTPYITLLERLVRVVHPKNAVLASQLAQAAGTTLEGLGLVKPAPVVAVVPPAPGPLVPYLVDSLVCAAADASGVVTSVIRPALLAAFERAAAVGLDVATVRDALRPPRKAGPPKTDAPT